MKVDSDDNRRAFLWVLFAILVCVIIVLLILVLGKGKTKKNEDTYDLVLKGMTDITLYVQDKYEEPGYYATLNGENVTKDVNVNDNVDTNRVGEYTIIYEYKDIVKKRIVKVIEKEIEYKDELLKLELNGDNKKTIFINETYEELGAKAYYDNQDISKDIKIESNINNKVAGTYTIKYSITYNNLSKTIERTVEVKEKEALNLNITYDEKYTNKNVLVNLEAIGTDYLYIKLPNGKTIDSKTYGYEVEKNGKYTFYIYGKDNVSVEHTIEIKNIDKEKPTGSCTYEYKNNKTTILVDAKDNIGIDYYVYNDSSQSKDKTFSVDKKLTSATTTIYDVSGNSNKINCKKVNKDIEIHFMVGVSDDDAILIRNNDNAIMIDGGRYKAKDKIVDYLKQIGVKKIDAMIGSHVAYNHVQAQAAILDNFDVSHAYYSVDIFSCNKKKIGGYYSCSSDDNKYVADKLKAKGTPGTVLKAGDSLNIGDMKLYFIGPTRGKLTTYTNANSLTFILEYENKKYMFTGDTPEKYLDIDKFTSYATQLGTTIDVDFFKWPHHGIEKVSEKFFKATTPDYVLIPNFHGCSNLNSSKKKLLKKYTKQYMELCDGKPVVLTSDGQTITMKKVTNPSDYKR